MNTGAPSRPEPDATLGDSDFRRARPAAGVRLELDLPAEVVEAIAERAAAIVLERLGSPLAGPPAAEFLTPVEAAALISASRQRIYDLCDQGVLRRYKDGARLLIRRSELIAYVEGVPPVWPPSRAGRSGSGVAG